MHSPVGISVGANRETEVLATVAHLRAYAMNIFTCTYTKGEDTLNGSIGSFKEAHQLLTLAITVLQETVE